MSHHQHPQLQDAFDFAQAPRTANATQIRSFHGYLQSREDNASPWKFQVLGFDGAPGGAAGCCFVLLHSGEMKRVPFDREGRITVRGRDYGRDCWDH
jgi:hypothetical protein